MDIPPPHGSGVLRSFPYSKRSFVINTFLIGALVVTITVLLLFAGVGSLYLATISLLGTLSFLILGISPLLTDHEILDGELILRQGWYFRGSIPLSEITGVSLVPKGPTRTGVFFKVMASTLFVTSRRIDLVEVDLRSKRGFRWALGKKADRVVFDVLERDALVRALESGLLPPVDAQGALT